MFCNCELKIKRLEEEIASVKRYHIKSYWDDRDAGIREIEKIVNTPEFITQLVGKINALQLNK